MTEGPVLKLFQSVIDSVSYKLLFVTVNHFQLSLTLTVKAGAYPTRTSYGKSSLSPSHYKTRLEVTNNVKQANIIRN